MCLEKAAHQSRKMRLTLFGTYSVPPLKLEADFFNTGHQTYNKISPCSTIFSNCAIGTGLLNRCP